MLPNDVFDVVHMIVSVYICMEALQTPPRIDADCQEASIWTSRNYDDCETCLSE